MAGEKSNPGRALYLGWWFFEYSLWTSTMASLGNLLEIQILGPCSKPTEPESSGKAINIPDDSQEINI
jgi:hypothetical protein